MSTSERSGAGRFVRRWAEHLELRPRHFLLVSGAVLWVTLAPLSALIGWASGQLHFIVAFLSFFLLLTVSGASVLILYAVAGRNQRAAKPVAAIADSPPTELPRIVDLAPGWSSEPRSQALTDFLQQFESSLNALRLRLLHRLGEELAPSVPLRQQISFADELGIWSPAEVEAWRACLTLRTRILTAGADAPLQTLNDHTAWLANLTRRTVPTLSH